MHTKGPWKLSAGADGWASIWSDKSEQIANILPPIANARLIAAAPELLEALENNNELLRTMVRELVIREDYRATKVADQIRDNLEAIRKAKEK